MPYTMKAHPMGKHIDAGGEALSPQVGAGLIGDVERRSRDKGSVHFRMSLPTSLIQ
jgi:hypothetical protein